MTIIIVAIRQVAETNENGSQESSEQQQVAMQHSAENHGSHMHVQMLNGLHGAREKKKVWDSGLQKKD